MAYTGSPHDDIREFDSLGEAEVRRLLPSERFGAPGSDARSRAEAWLASKEALRRSASDARSEAREEAMLSIAEEANSIALRACRDARRANIIAIIAMILTVTTVIATASDKVIFALQWLRVLKP